MTLQLKKDFYRQAIEFRVVDQFGSVPEIRSYFYDHIVSYGPSKVSRAVEYESHEDANAYIVLRHKAENGLFAEKKFYVTHSVEDLENMFAEAEYKIEQRKPFELQQTNSIRMDFLRASIQLNVVDNPLSSKMDTKETVFYDQIVGHGPYNMRTQYISDPSAKAYVLLKNDGCFGKRKLYVRQTEDELRGLFKGAEVEIEDKAIGLLKQLNL